MIKSKENSYPFFRFPRALIENPIFSNVSIEARTLLALIIDRSELSSINAEAYTDKNGNIYVIYTVEEVCRKFGCGKTKASRLFSELESNGMILRKRENGSKPSKIYVTQPIFNCLNQDFARSRNRTLQSHGTGICKVTESDAIYTEYINNEIINTDLSIKEYGPTEDEIKEQIEYECIVCDGNKNLLDEIVMIISDVLGGTSRTVRIEKDDVPREKVDARFRKLNSENIMSVIAKIENNTSKIRNVKAYIISMLYNAPATEEISVTAEFAYNTLAS